MIEMKHRKSKYDPSNTSVGYQQPPRNTRFAKGQSGNPAGRPRSRHRHAPYEAILGQIVTIRENGVERRVTASDAFLLQLVKRGMEGDGAASRVSLALIEQARAEQRDDKPLTIVRVIVDPGSVTAAAETLRMATKLDPYRKTARLVVEPWMVQAALERMPQPPTAAEQRTIVQATRAPQKVRWPQWWTELP